MVQIKQLILTFFILGLNLAVLAQSGTIITNIQLVDGTGKPAINASVRIVGNKIVAIGNLKPNKMDQMIDGKGKI
jgi:N-acyl-D-aspartate/D-glutamate deacylase